MAAARHRFDDDEGPAEMPFFKPNEDFLRFLTMGAAGSAETAEDLRERGHSVVGLERATMSNKMWTTKLKRLRLPDLLCIDCGLRIEARAKSKLAVKLSESATEREGRMWDYGLRDGDLIAFLRWDDASATTTRPHYFTVKALRDAQRAGGSTLGPPKSASQGAERDRAWKATVPGRGGEVLEIGADRHSVVARLDNGASRRQTYRIAPPLPAYAYVPRGARFRAFNDFLLGVVAPPRDEDLRCPGRTWDYTPDLNSEDDVARYIAVRAAGLRRDSNVGDQLRQIAELDASDRVRLEGAASLALIDPERYAGDVIAFAGGEVHGATIDPALAMEAIFVLSEFASDTAAEALLEVARDAARDSEVRAAAVWGLGSTGADLRHQVVEFIADDDADVAMHAIVAAGILSPDDLDAVAQRLGGSDREGAAAAALLARQGEAGARALLRVALEDYSEAGVWALVGLGQMPRIVVESAAADDLPEELTRALEPAWALNERSWLPRSLLDDPLTFLARQTIQHRTPEAAAGEGPPARHRDDQA